MKFLRLHILAPVLVLLLLLWSMPAFAGRAVTLYLDGAVIERSESAKNGYLEILLPPSARSETLRIKPAGGAQIIRVQVDARQPGKRVEKELAAIGERQELLQDRLRALSVREEIFRSAAKSQSAKAPRKTKTNPEPMTTIRQGTDYAIAQLEGVYQAQRRVNRELKQLEEKRARLSRDEQAGGSVARIWLSPANGLVSATYIQSDRSWQPRYEIRAKGDGMASLAVFPDGVEPLAGEQVAVRPAKLAEGESGVVWRFTERFRPLMTTELPAGRKAESADPVPRFQLSLANSTAVPLPAGDYTCYADGVYLGRGRLPLLQPGGTADLQCGSN